MNESNQIVIEYDGSQWTWEIVFRPNRQRVVDCWPNFYDSAEEALAAGLEAERKYEEKRRLADEASDAAGRESATA